jgi:hypothetical protein
MKIEDLLATVEAQHREKGEEGSVARTENTKNSQEDLR